MNLGIWSLGYLDLTPGIDSLMSLGMQVWLGLASSNLYSLFGSSDEIRNEAGTSDDTLRMIWYEDLDGSWNGSIYGILDSA